MLVTSLAFLLSAALRCHGIFTSKLPLMTIALLFPLMTPFSTKASEQHITFSEFPLGTSVENQYKPRGIYFFAASIVQDIAFPQSPALAAREDIDFNSLGMAFVTPLGDYRPISTISFDVGPFNAPNEMVVTWYKIVNNTAVLINLRGNTKVGVERISISTSEPMVVVRIERNLPPPHVYQHWRIDNVSFDGIDPVCGVGAPACEPRIAMTGVGDITNNVQPIKVVVGQQIDLVATTPAGSVSQLWTPTGNPIAGYTVSPTCPKTSSARNPPDPCQGRVVPYGPTFSTLKNTTFYWTTPGQYNVIFKYTTAAGVVYTALAKFDVSGPRNSPLGKPFFTVKRGYNELLTIGGVLSTTCGISSAQPCVLFTRDANIQQPSLNSGVFFWVQTVEYHTKIYRITPNGANHLCRVLPGRYLDGAYPYPITPLSATTQDSPGWSVDVRYVSHQENFRAKMHLMWQARGIIAVPVSLGYVDWAWTGGATKVGATWKRGPRVQATATYHPSSSYPVWESVRVLPPECR